MVDYNPQKFDVKSITSIVPVYDLDNKNELTAGHFNIRYIQIGFDQSRSFCIKFTSVINNRAKNDANLFNFLMENYKDKSLSLAVSDLYDIGFPVDEWVVDYLEHVLGQNDHFATMLVIMATLRDFNKDQSDDDILT